MKSIFKGLMAAAVLAGTAFGGFASATTTNSDSFSLSLDQVVYNQPVGSTYKLLDHKVDSRYVGSTCAVMAIARNQGSVWPNNDIIIASGGKNITAFDVEREGAVKTPANGELVLGENVAISVKFGETGRGIFSAGIDVNFDCAKPKCALDNSLSADDKKCVPCKFDDKIIASSSYCPAVCEFDDSIAANDAKCKVCALDSSILASDAKCKVCALNDNLLASDGKCVECQLDNTILATDEKCVPCELDSSILASDAKCKPCALEASITASDPACKACSLDNTILATDTKCVACEYDSAILASDVDCKPTITVVEPKTITSTGAGSIVALASAVTVSAGTAHSFGRKLFLK